LDVEVEGKVWGTAEILLHLPRPDVVSHCGLPHAYTFSGRIRVNKSAVRDNGIQIILRQGDSGLELPIRTAAPRRYVGGFDGFREGVLHGWALDSLSQEPLEVEVRLDGRPIGRGCASLSRPDVATRYLGCRLVGFQIAPSLEPLIEAAKLCPLPLWMGRS
jgi:hypothetical protein